MNFIDDTLNSFEESTRETDILVDKCMIFAESSYNELQINYDEAELKVLKESGSIDDYTFLTEAASEGFINRAQKSVEKAIEAFKDFIKKMVATINNTFNSVKTKIVLDKVEKAAKSNPKLKGKKINVKNIEKEQKVYQEGIDQLERKLARLKGGKYSSKDIEDIDNIVSNTKKKAMAVSVVVLSITTAIAIIGKVSSDYNSESSASIKRMLDATGSASDDFSKVTSPESVRAIAKTKHSIIMLGKEQLKSISNGVSSLFRQVRGAVVLKNVNESVEEATTETLVEESTYTHVLYDEIFGESVDDIPVGEEEYTEEDTVEESVEDDVESLENYYESLEAELFNEADDIEIEEPKSPEKDKTGASTEESPVRENEKALNESVGELDVDSFMEKLEAELPM